MSHAALLFVKFQESLIPPPDIEELLAVSGVNGRIHRVFRVRQNRIAKLEECNLDASHWHEATEYELDNADLDRLCEICFPRA